MYSSPPVLVLRVFRKRGERKVIGKKRLILASLDSKYIITMHWPFLRASRATLKGCSSIFLFKF
jgi:hypothetical protein